MQKEKYNIMDEKQNIDGYVSKDNLYRLMSKLRLQDAIITEEQAHVICEKIAELPDELRRKNHEIKSR